MQRKTHIDVIAPRGTLGVTRTVHFFEVEDDFEFLYKQGNSNKEGKLISHPLLRHMVEIQVS